MASSRSEQKTLSTTQNNRLTGKAPYKSAANLDRATGLFSAIAILMALHEREKSGKGQFCDMTLHDCGMALLHPHAANFLLNAKRPKATGNPHPNLAPYSKFQTRPVVEPHISKLQLRLPEVSSAQSSCSEVAGARNLR